MENKKSVTKNYQTVVENINKVKAEQNITRNIKLIAVSKKRSVDLIKECYDCGNRIFGENYVNELLEKCEKLPKDIEWHLIGHLQSNKIKKLLETIPTIIIESVDSVKLAIELQKNAVKLGINKLGVYIEVNISNSETKTGAKLDIIDSIAKEIIENCPNLQLLGIMSLGEVDNTEEFAHMIKIKNEFVEKYKLSQDTFIASFGTSQDYENAIKNNSDEVRVGHQIFEI